MIKFFANLSDKLKCHSLTGNLSLGHYPQFQIIGFHVYAESKGHKNPLVYGNHMGCSQKLGEETVKL